jgi:hypothetical protein
MSLTRQIQLRKGTVSLSVFKGETDGKVMVSLDKDFVSRRVKGPLFSESELYDLVDIIADYDEWESKVVHGAANGRLLAEAPSPQPTLPAGYDTAVAQHEIEEAIRGVSSNDHLKQQTMPAMKVRSSGYGRITVLSPLPKFEYLHTCSKCGCHVESTLRIGGTALKLCPGCKQVREVIC